MKSIWKFKFLAILTLGIISPINIAYGQPGLSRGSSIICTAPVSQAKGTVFYSYDGGNTLSTAGSDASIGNATIRISRDRTGTLTLSAILIDSGIGDSSFSSVLTYKGIGSGTRKTGKDTFKTNRIKLQLSPSALKVDALSKIFSYMSDLESAKTQEYVYSLDQIKLVIPSKVLRGNANQVGRVSVRWSLIDKFLVQQQGEFRFSSLACRLE